MPEMNGPELADRLAAERPGMRVLYVSGYAPDPGNDPVAPGEGAEFLAKPFGPAVLLKRVREILDADPDPGYPRPSSSSSPSVRNGR